MELTNMIRDGDINGVKNWLNDNPDPTKDQISNGGVSIAHWAASAENTQILELIIKQLPSLINGQNYEDGTTPLHWAAQDNRDKNVQFLLSKGAELLTDHMGETPLHLASMNGYLQCVQLLAAHGGVTQVNLPSIEGNTALHLATLNSNKRVVAYLLSQGADPDKPNKKKETPRSIALNKKDNQLLDYFDPEKLRLLEDTEKLQDENEALQGKLVDFQNIAEAEIRKREVAYTTIKLKEERIAELESERDSFKSLMQQQEAEISDHKRLIVTLKTELEASQAAIDRLKAAAAASESNQHPVIHKPAFTAQDFPSELIYSRVRSTQTDLQKLHNILEQSEQAILTAKTSINQLEESLGSTKRSTTLCRYFLAGNCRFGDHCNFVHALPDPSSTSYECSICYETIKHPKEFGILSECDHLYCYECIIGWRTTKSMQGAKTCPQCRKTSAFVWSSPNLLSGEDKESFKKQKQEKLSKIPCKYFGNGNGWCRFAPNCFYLHCLHNGELALDEDGNQHAGTRKRRARPLAVRIRHIRDILVSQSIESASDDSGTEEDGEYESDGSDSYLGALRESTDFDPDVYAKITPESSLWMLVRFLDIPHIRDPDCEAIYVDIDNLGQLFMQTDFLNGIHSDSDHDEESIEDIESNSSDEDPTDTPAFLANRGRGRGRATVRGRGRGRR